MHRNKSVFLDLDGTLIDSKNGILSSCRVALRFLGHEMPADFDIASIIGPPIQDVMRYLLASTGDTRIDVAVEAYRADYGTDGYTRSELYPDIREMLEALNQSGADLFLATSKLEAFAVKILDNLDLSDLFQGVHGAVPDVGRDHKPELLQYILKENDLDPHDCVMVGDRRYDIIGAHANNLRGIGVLWGYGSREELERCGADALVDRPMALVDLLQSETARR
ncbi:HAD hydrolase-like protein [Rhizobium sp. GR12]|uniref:HAD hydrolase-like protein n=1 Tax=Rhizobium sp. GR12 TaxID=3053925 RepID=UPI002FBF0461